MRAVDITTVLIGLGLVVVGMYDLVAAVSVGPEATVSWVVRQWSARWPLIPFSIGVLIGHFFG